MTTSSGAFSVDAKRCIACAACATVAPGVFRVRNGACHVLRSARDDELRSCRVAVLNCPTHAIRRAHETPAAPSDPDRADELARLEDLAVQAEMARWALSDIPWDSLEPEAASPELRALVREMAFSEHATYSATQRFLQAFNDHVEFGQWIATWFYEETRHPQVLVEWLRRLGEPVDRDFTRRARVSTPFMKSKMGTLVTNVISEMTAAQAYSSLAESSAEPVLSVLARRISGDEARHASSFHRFARAHLDASERPDRERLDGLKVLSFWVSGRDQVSHPVNQMLQRLGGGREAAITGIRFEKLEARVIRIIGLLIDLELTEVADVETRLRDLVGRIHHTQ